jgi:hypothetical protein
MSDNNNKPEVPMPTTDELMAELQPDTTPIKKEDVQTQFAVIRTKDGRIAVQFPILDLTTQTVDIPLAMELAGAGLQTLAQVVRQQLKQTKPLIAVVPAMPGLKT